MARARQPRGADAGDRPGPRLARAQGRKLYVRYHEALTAAGFGVLVFDYRGFGDSGGATRALAPRRSSRTSSTRSRTSTTRDDVDADAIGAFGTGGTGGGNAILLAAADPRVRGRGQPGAGGRRRGLAAPDAVASPTGSRSSPRWTRTGSERVADRQGPAACIRARRSWCRRAERRTTTIKADVDDRIPTQVSLAARGRDPRLPPDRRRARA